MSMQKKTMLFIFPIILFVVFSGVLIAISKDKAVDIDAFDVSDYNYYIMHFPSEENLGNVSSTDELLEKVEAIWIEEYGEEVKNEKPYQLLYDEKNDVWLVQGTLPLNMMGGVANILVEGNTGKVLAIWHDK